MHIGSCLRTKLTTTSESKSNDSKSEAKAKTKAKTDNTVNWPGGASRLRLRANTTPTAG